MPDRLIQTTNGLPLIEPDWPAPSRIKAYTTTRQGGFSAPPFDSFNLASHVEDNPETVAKNHAHLLTSLKLPSSPIWLHQTHSTTVVIADQVPPGITADASCTEQHDVICAVLTADCLPILLCSKDGTEVAAIHAGWRGLIGGIIEKTIHHMNSEGAECMAWLGPAISATHYEVDHAFQTQFLTQDPSLEPAFTLKNGKYSANLYAIATHYLQKSAVQSIYGGHFCTYTDHESFFSYRRDKKTGRIASFIWIDSAH